MQILAFLDLCARVCTVMDTNSPLHLRFWSAFATKERKHTQYTKLKTDLTHGFFSDFLQIVR